MEKDPKSEFLKHVVVRAGADTTKPERFPCGHLQCLGKEHLAVGEHFPYGAQGAELLACVVCEPKEACPDHALARQIAQLSRGEITRVEDPEDRFIEWHELSWADGGTACDTCEGEPPVVLSYFCNDENQVFYFRPWTVLARYLNDELEKVAEDPESYNPEPPVGAVEERATWVRELLEIAMENEDPESPQADWIYGLQCTVGEEKSYSILQCEDLSQGGTLNVIRSFPTLQLALAFRSAWGADDVASLNVNDLARIEALAIQVRVKGVSDDHA